MHVVMQPSPQSGYSAWGFVTQYYDLGDGSVSAGMVSLILFDGSTAFHRMAVLSVII